MTDDEKDRSRGTTPRPESGLAIETLHHQLRDAVEALESGDQWRAWLDFAGRLHRYSFNNVILIWTQCPAASTVASYRTWQSLGRNVRRGERAIRVLAPVTRRTAAHAKKDSSPVDVNESRRVERQVVGFRPVPVFDVSQTDGRPLPDPHRPALLKGSAPAGMWDLLATDVAERGYRLMRGPIGELDGANGVTRIEEREVWVRDDVDEAHALKTLVHELAHIVLHAGEDGNGGRCRGLMEVEAESVAHLVLATHQVDTAAYTFPYVASWAHPLASVEHVSMADIISRTGNRVMKAADQIMAVTAEALTTPSDSGFDALSVRVAMATSDSARLRDQAGVAVLPATGRPILLGVTADSQDFFRRQLSRSWVPAYLEGRQLGVAAVSHHLGHAPNGWTTLIDHLRGLGYSDDHIEAAGMAKRARNGRLIDYFRDRVTIPVRDSHGDLVGFTARRAPSNSDVRVPRYLNSPTTAIFRKSEVLYGLAAHHHEISHGALAVVCEGPLDAIAIDLLAASRGLRLAGLAITGTAFTRHHAEQLLAAANTGSICLALDGDDAGRKAAAKIWRRLTDDGPHQITIADLPAGTDPASLYQSDRPALTQLVADARPAASVVATRQIMEAHREGNVAQDLAVFRHLLPLAGRMPPEQRSAFVLALAEHLRIDPADAATDAIERNPKLLMDRAIDNCEQLRRALGSGTGVREMMAAEQLSERATNAFGDTVRMK